MRHGSLAVILITLAAVTGASAQDTTDLGLPPPSGSQNPVLPPPSGSQNPVLPPQSGQRYLPGIGGRFGGNADIPGMNQRPVLPPQPRNGSGEIGVVGGLAPATQPFEGETLDRLTDIAPALRRCWTPPPLDGPDTGVMATVRFSLRRDGSLFGQPRVMWETSKTDPDLRRRFTESVVAAVRACTPMRLSPPLGAAIAGRPLSIRFHGRAPSNERPI
ncbi:MAG TPA: hypothetical protein VGN82_13840 [Bosea sp. (in: a-proteobacteria)]|jgi:hypothetical protein|uniref:hypothetical protein n=1 Tax=Bosea sp. (in: a-proteobacteria) TaxID=1871050 RepID=UPI002E11425A|nr:hypothetical protein [Bosea sp. (in: a-proteobacteria)]